MRLAGLIRDVPSAPYLIELPYPQDAGLFFTPLADSPWFIWLDSAARAGDPGVQDVCVAFPRFRIWAHGPHVFVEGAEGVLETHEAPLEVVSRYLRAQDSNNDEMYAVGYFGYDMARTSFGLPPREPGAIPDMAVGIYEGCVRLDHEARTCCIRALDTPSGRQWAQNLARVLQRPASCALERFKIGSAVLSNMDYAAYRQAFHQVENYIRAGDCYQVNLAMRFSAPFVGHPWYAYLALRAENPAPYSAWLNLPFGCVLSSSPESLLRVQAGTVTTRPIKGTRRRSADVHEDRQRLSALSASAKDRAENLMIVDLLRNDLGKVCQWGSVHVPELFRVESFATVHHLVSTVTGRLAPGQDALTALAAAFPGGSITGAPKRRAMEIIDQLEPQPREVYCGAIGYLDARGDMDLNIAIRTMVCSGGEVRYWAGGGLVADSRVEDEYQECLDKGHALKTVLERFLDPRPDSLTS